MVRWLLRCCVLFPLLVGVGVLMASLHGMLHNQVSYTVSHEYFTAFKFRQFGTPDAIPPRLAAALVGFRASWWMGLLLGLPLAATAMVNRTAAGVVRDTLLAYLVVLVVATLSAVAGLALGMLGGDGAAGPPSWTPEGVTDPWAFHRAGCMHNGSYLGGGIGLLVAWPLLCWRTIRRRARELEREQQSRLALWRAGSG